MPNTALTNTMTIKEAASFLGMPDSTLVAQLRRGKLRWSQHNDPQSGQKKAYIETRDVEELHKRMLYEKQALEDGTLMMVADVAECLGIEVSKLHRWIDNNYVKYYRLVNGQRTIEKLEVARLQECIKEGVSVAEPCIEHKSLEWQFPSYEEVEQWFRDKEAAMYEQQCGSGFIDLGLLWR